MASLYKIKCLYPFLAYNKLLSDIYIAIFRIKSMGRKSPKACFVVILQASVISTSCFLTMHTTANVYQNPLYFLTHSCVQDVGYKFLDWSNKKWATIVSIQVVECAYRMHSTWSWVDTYT